jgi:hypothetical protein
MFSFKEIYLTLIYRKNKHFRVPISIFAWVVVRLISVKDSISRQGGYFHGRKD